MIKDKFYSRLAELLTMKWISEYKLPYKWNSSVGLITSFDRIVYRNNDFVFSNSDKYGSIIPRAEVFAAVWDQLLEHEQNRIMADTLGHKND